MGASVLHERQGCKFPDDSASWGRALWLRTQSTRSRCALPSRRRSRSSAIYIAILALVGPPAVRAGNVCVGGGGHMDWTLVGDDPIEYPNCGNQIVSCRPVESPGPTYSVESGCDPQAGPCGVTATVPVYFPDNHGNTTDFGPIALTKLYYGPAVGIANETCGDLGGLIPNDRGIVTVGVSVDCTSPGEFLWTLRLSYCEITTGQGGCRFFRVICHPPTLSV